METNIFPPMTEKTFVVPISARSEEEVTEAIENEITQKNIRISAERRHRNSFFNVGGLKRKTQVVTVAIQRQISRNGLRRYSNSSSQVHPIQVKPVHIDGLFCKLCNLEFSSNEKLERHLKFSTLHINNLGKNSERMKTQEEIDHEKEDQEEQIEAELIFKGNKLFIKKKIVLEVSLYLQPCTKYRSYNRLILIVYNMNTKMEYPRLYFNEDKLHPYIVTMGPCKGVPKDLMLCTIDKNPRYQKMENLLARRNSLPCLQTMNTSYQQEELYESIYQNESKQWEYYNLLGNWFMKRLSLLEKSSVIPATPMAVVASTSTSTSTSSSSQLVIHLLDNDCITLEEIQGRTPKTLIPNLIQIKHEEISTIYHLEEFQRKTKELIEEKNNLKNATLEATQAMKEIQNTIKTMDLQNEKNQQQNQTTIFKTKTNLQNSVLETSKTTSILNFASKLFGSGKSTAILQEENVNPTDQNNPSNNLIAIQN